MRGQYCPFRDVTRTRKLRNDNDKTKISNAASLACLLSACGGLSPESIICSQDPTACEDPNTPNTPDTPTITTIDNSTGIYDALAGSYSANGTASLTVVEKASDSRSGGNDTQAINDLAALSVDPTTPATWAMDITINSNGLTISNSSLDLDETASDIIVSDSINMNVSNALVQTDGTNEFLNVTLAGTVEYIDYYGDPTGNTVEQVADLASTGRYMHLQADTTVNNDGTGSLDNVTSDGDTSTVDIYLGLDPSDQTFGLGATEYTTTTFN